MAHKDPEARRAYNRAYYLANTEKRLAYEARVRDRRRAYSKAYGLTHRPEKLRWVRAWSAKNPLQALCLAAFARARRAGVPFDLDLSKTLTIPELCPILHLPLIPRGKDRCGRRWNAPSLDRIIPERGYVVGNVRVISMLANSMKQNATPEQLRTFAANIGAYLEGF